MFKYIKQLSFLMKYDLLIYTLNLETEYLIKSFDMNDAQVHITLYKWRLIHYTLVCKVTRIFLHYCNFIFVLLSTNMFL